MKILLTGASSYVGARIYFDLSKQFDVIGTYNGTKLSEKFIRLDLSNFDEIRKVISKQKPKIIIHAAAGIAKWCEENPEKAIVVNQEATKYVVDAANAIDAKVIFISSFHAANPLTVYAKTKQRSEDYVKQTKAGYAILRLFHVMGFSPNIINDRAFNRLLHNLDGETEAIYDSSWKVHPVHIGHI